MARVCRFRVRPTPYEYLVVMDFSIITVFEREREVGIKFQPRFVGEPVDPSLRIRLRAFYWAHIVGFTVICDVI